MHIVRLGVIVPSVNTVLEPELSAMSPAIVTLHFARARYIYRGAADTADPLVGMAKEALTAAEQLRDAGVQVLGYGSTGGSFFAGPSYHQELTRELERVSSVPCTTASTAVLEALRALGATSVAVATPYVEMDNKREEALLREHGFHVCRIIGMGIHDGGAIRDVPLESVRSFVRDVFRYSADVYFISCTNLRASVLINELEADLGRPVITSNQALLWHMLRLAGVKTSVRGYGYLLSECL